jgi:hypothetical protein
MTELDKKKIPVIELSFDEEAGKLMFEDNQGNSGFDITTLVRCGQKVIWKVAKGQKIIITKIYNKEGSQNIFEGSGPVDQHDGTCDGTVLSDASGSERYNVDYTIDGKEYSDDPELKVKE